MSRIGKNPVLIPSNVDVSMNGLAVSVKGPNGTLEMRMHPQSHVEMRDGESGKELVVTMAHLDSKENRALWGTMRTLLQNMIVGVTEGFQKQLEVNGVGYKVALQGNGLKLDVGFSHSVGKSSEEVKWKLKEPYYAFRCEQSARRSNGGGDSKDSQAGAVQREGY